MENGNPQLHLTTSQIAQRNRIDRHAVFHEDVDRAERIRHTWCAADARVKIGEIGLERLKAAPCMSQVTTWSLRGEREAAAIMPASCSRPLMAAPRPPMPPVTKATRFWARSLSPQGFTHAPRRVNITFD
jgi:hypothetical protein